MRTFNLYVKSSLIAFIITATPIDAMTQHKEMVLCPNIEKVRQSAPLINKVMGDSRFWIVSSDKPILRDNNLSWNISINFLRSDADSKDAAIKLAQKYIANAVSVLYEEPYEARSGELVCGYYVKANTILIAVQANQKC